MKLRHAALVAGLALGLMSGAAKASYVFTVTQDGKNVDVDGSGSVDTDILSFEGSTISQASLIPSIPLVITGGTGTADVYGTLNESQAFANLGPGGSALASSGSGDLVGINDVPGQPFNVFVPSGYVSGDSLDSHSTYDNQTISSLGFTVGDYTFTYSNAAGTVSDTFIVDVSSVPLPSSAPMFGVALLALGAVGYGLKRKAKAAAA